MTQDRMTTPELAKIEAVLELAQRKPAWQEGHLTQEQRTLLDEYAPRLVTEIRSLWAEIQEMHLNELTRLGQEMGEYD